MSTYPSRYGVLALVARKELVRLLVVLPELFDDVLATVAVLLLDPACDLELVFGWDMRHFTALTHEVEHELGDITPGDRNMLDRGANHISFRTGDNVGDTVARIDDGAG